MTRVAVILLLLCSQVQATNYYFSSSGSDGNSGTAPGSPKQTESAIKTRLASLSAGDTVFFARGSVWNEIDINMTVDGTSGSRIVLAAYGTGSRPLFKGSAVMTGWSQSGNVWSKTDSRIKGTKENWVDWWTGSYQDYDRRTGFLPAIWINGTASYISHYPNSAPMSFSNVDNTGYTYANGASSTLPGSDALAGAQLKIMQGHWSLVYTTITGNTTTDIDITSGDFDSQFGELDDGAKGMIINSTNATIMDQNGEYAINNSTQTLSVYYSGTLTSQTVEVPVVDSILCLTGADYITIQGLEFRGSRGNGIKIRGCTGVRVTDCKVSYCTLQGVHITGSTNAQVDYCDISYCDNGIGSRHNTTPTLTKNYIHRIGQDPALGDIEGASGNGVYMADRTGVANITYNYFDSINYNAVHIHSNGGDDSPGINIYGNYARRWCNIKTDGAAYYLVSSNENVSILVRRNIAYEASDKSAWISDDGHTEGIYLDNAQGYTTVDSNSVYNSPSLLFINYNGDYNTVRGNKGMTFNKTGYSNAALYAESLGSINDLTLTGNEFVVTDAATFLIRWNGNSSEPNWSCSGCSFTNNKYFNNNSGSTVFQKIEYWGTQHNYSTIAAWQTYTGIESGSTQKFLSTLGADASVMLVNYSDSAHVFNLGTNVYKDYAGTSVSGTVSIPMYSTRILYHISGSGGDGTTYTVNPLNELGVTGGGEMGGTGGTYRIPYRKGVEQVPDDEGVEMKFYD